MNIKEVAARANLSTATVSRTINNSGLVRPGTAEKVQRAIRELGYYPNTQARALVSGRSRMFGLIISDIVNPFFPELVKSFEFAAIHHGYEVIVANTDYDSDRMSGCVRRMIERKVDGVAVMTSELDRHLLDELSHRRLPIVFLDVGKLKPLISNINVDYSRGIGEAVQHIVSLGHQRVGFVSGPLTLKSARTRRSAFLKCIAACGIGETATERGGRQPQNRRRGKRDDAAALASPSTNCGAHLQRPDGDGNRGAPRRCPGWFTRAQ